jgi:hypothetical protein
VFFALNYKQLHQKTSNSGWFVKSFSSAIPNSLSDLKEKISQGDDSFVSKLAYFGKATTGLVKQQLDQMLIGDLKSQSCLLGSIIMFQSVMGHLQFS